MRPLSPRLVAVLTAAAIAAGAAGACGGGDGAAAGPVAAREVRASAMPPSLLGLRAEEEDVRAQLAEAGDRAYVTDVRLWSLREGDRLRATLEIAVFAPDAPTHTTEFQAQVAAQVGGTAPRTRLVGEDRVNVSAGNRQVFYSWFRGAHLVLLTVPADTATPKALLRAALAEVAP